MSEDRFYTDTEISELKLKFKKEIDSLKSKVERLEKENKTPKGFWGFAYDTHHNFDLIENEILFSGNTNASPHLVIPGVTNEHLEGVKKQILDNQRKAKGYNVMKRYLVDVLNVKQLKGLELLLDDLAVCITSYLKRDDAK